MMKRPPHTLLALLIAPLFVGALTQCAFADDHDRRDHELARQALVEGRIKPLTEITELFQQQMQGEIVGVEIEREKKSGAFVYEFKVLTPEGQLKEVNVDATTGKILGIEDDD